MGERVNFRLEPNSKVFMSLLRSAFYILLLPMLISIGLSAMFIMNMEKEAEGFRRVALEQLTGEVNQEFWSAYQLINRVKNSELIASYAKSDVRDYWTEYQIHKYMSKVLVGTNLETAYLYFPQYEMVFSVTGGGRKRLFPCAELRQLLRGVAGGAEGQMERECDTAPGKRSGAAQPYRQQRPEQRESGSARGDCRGSPERVYESDGFQPAIGRA